MPRFMFLGRFCAHDEIQHLKYNAPTSTKDLNCFTTFVHDFIFTFRRQIVAISFHHDLY